MVRAGQQIAIGLLAQSFAGLTGADRTQLLGLLAKVGAGIGEPDPLTAS